MMTVAALGGGLGSAQGSQGRLAEASSNPSNDGLGPEVAVPKWALHRNIHFFAPPGHAGRGAESPLSTKLREVGFLGRRCEPGYCPSTPLGYRLGNVQQRPTLYLVFWGGNWNSEPGSALRGNLVETFKYLTRSRYQGILTQYYEESAGILGRISPEVVVAAAYTDTSCRGPAGIVEASIVEELNCVQAKNGWPTGGVNNQFIVFSAPGSSYSFTEFEQKQFCAYHEQSGETVFAYVPYAGDPYFSGCLGFDASRNAAHVTSMAAAHEYAEAVTDPHPHTGWVDGEGYEIGDICASGDDTLGGNIWVQGLWSNSNNACVLEDPIIEARPPILSPQPASNITTNSAVLSAQVYSNGLSTKSRFEYGESAGKYEHQTAETLVGNKLEWKEVAASVSGLLVCKPYHARPVAWNEEGIVDGPDEEFTTTCIPPAVTTTSATSVEARKATLNGTVNPEGQATKYHFEYGVTNSYGTSTAEQSAGEGRGSKAESAVVTLVPNETYHYRIVASNATGANQGSDASFTTPAVPPVVKAESAAGVNMMEATLRATVDPEKASTSYYFEYGPTTAYGSRIPLTSLQAGSGLAPVAVSQRLRFAKLEPTSTFHFRIVATNVAGTVRGEDSTFQTPSVEWRLGGAASSESLVADWKGQMKLVDESATLYGAECEESANGFVAPGGLGEVTSWTASKCVATSKEETLASCKSGTITLKALNLPWRSELVSAEGTKHDILTSGGKGTPGYRMECELKIGGHAEVECTGSIGSITANSETGVTVTLDPKEKLTCNKEPGKGVLEGAQGVAATAGGRLSTVNAGEAAKLSETQWRLGGTALHEEAAVSWKGPLKLTAESLPTVDDVECEESASGSVAPDGVGEVTSWTASKCVAVNKEETVTSCKSGSITLKALHLPWRSELVSVEGKHDVLVGGGGGTPGFKVECELKIGGSLAYECAGAVGTTTANAETGVVATLDPKEKLNCNTNKEARKGVLEGAQSVEATAGGRLSAVNAAEAAKLSEAEWRLSGAPLGASIPATWTGNVKLTDESMPAVYDVECEASASGSVGTGNGGEVKSWTASKCVPVNREETLTSCKSGSIALKALHLPWRSELVNVEGVKHDVLVSAGSGTPGVKMECEPKIGGSLAYECTGAIGTTTANAETGVVATLDPKEKLNCNPNKEARKGVLESSQTIKASEGGKLEAT